MSQDPDVGTLTLLIVVGYWYWRICRSIGNPRADRKTHEAGSDAPILPFAKRGTGSRTPVHDSALVNWLLQTGSASADALAGIRIADRSFNAVQFLRGAVTSYEAVLAAFEEGNLCVLADLTSADVYRAFVDAIMRREQHGQPLEWTLVGIDDVTIVSAKMEGTVASIAVRFSARFMISRRLGSSERSEESEEGIVAVRDNWRFARDPRSGNPNWQLIATGSE